MSADNYIGVWFDGNGWRVQSNLSASLTITTQRELERLFENPSIGRFSDRAVALAAAHRWNAESAHEYGVRIITFPAATIAAIYKEALIKIIDECQGSGALAVQLAREALSPTNFTEDDPRAQLSAPMQADPSFVPGKEAPINPEEAEDPHKKHMEHLLEKSSVPAVHYLAGAVKHLLADAFALGKMSDEHAGRLNRLENMIPTGRIDGLLDRVAAIEEIIQVVPPGQRPMFRIQKLEDRIVKLEANPAIYNGPLSELVNILIHARTRVEEKEVLESFQRRLVKAPSPTEALAADAATLLNWRATSFTESLKCALATFENHIEDVDRGGAISKDSIREMKAQAKLIRRAIDHQEETAKTGCTCAVILADDKTRHFRGCPLREKYSDHPAAHEAERTSGLRPEQAAAVVHYECLKHGLRLSACCEAARRREPFRPPSTFGDIIPTAAEREGFKDAPDPFRPRVARVIVCLCGSTRFSKAFADANLEETLKGNIVLTVGSMTHSDNDLFSCEACNAAGHYHDILKSSCPKGAYFHTTGDDDRGHKIVRGLEPPVKEALDALHRKKIELADEILVLNAKACRYCKRAIVDACTVGMTKPGDCDCIYEPYIGDSTRSEIMHAFKLKKPIRFLNKPLRYDVTHLLGNSAWDYDSQDDHIVRAT